MKPGDLCIDHGCLCVLVKIGEPSDAPWARLSEQAGMLQSFGYFLDLESPEIRFGQLFHGGVNLGENYSGKDVAALFTRSLTAVTWLLPRERC